MGLSNVGTPLSHEDTMKWAPYVRQHGITQFINLYKKQKNRKNDPFKWGDEIEYSLVKFNRTKREVKLSLRSCQLLEDINQDIIANEFKRNGLWTPEYAAYMIEGTPAEPYEGLNFREVQKNMRKRRKELQKFLTNNEELICITSFPRLGCKNFSYPQTEPTPNEGLTKSRFFPDDALFPGHPRYANTTKNVLGRRGEKPYYNVPIFKDKNTKFPVDNCYKTEKNALPDHVYLDSMGFGGGYSCLQTTFQASNVNEARILYDQLAPFCPIMMALTAAAPFHRGFITDIDTRWNVLCNTHDCRTEEERNLKPLKKNKFVIPKARYSSIDCYISPQGERYNDSPVLYHEEDYKKLIRNGVDFLLAKHIAHLFVRDCISMFKENIYQNDEEETGHFENIQSTNWQSLRFKPPPPNTSIGWRVEFRPCDLQTTDFENAAVVCFLTLLTRIILTYKLNFLIPISKVDENIEKAHKRNAVKEQKFWFRRNVFPNNEFLENITTNDITTCGDKNGFNRISNELSNWHPYYTNNGNSKNSHKTTNGTNHHVRSKINDQIINNNNGYSQDANLVTYDIHNNDDIFYDINENDFNNNCKKLNDTNTHNENGYTHDVSNVVNSDNGHSNDSKKKNNKINDINKCIENGDEFVEMTVDEIMNGKTDDFPGIIPIMIEYLKDLNLDTDDCNTIKQYLRLIGGRASGEILTTSAWMRNFVMKHPAYRHDSTITEEINYDLIATLQKIQNGELSCPELLG